MRQLRTPSLHLTGLPGLLLILSAIGVAGCSGHPDPASGDEFYVRKAVRAGDDSERAVTSSTEAAEEIKANLSETERAIEQANALSAQAELSHAEVEARARKLGVKLSPAYSSGHKP